MTAGAPRGEIFIGSDDEKFCWTLSDYFRAAGFRVIGFPVIELLIERARSQVPACIVLDRQTESHTATRVLGALNAKCYAAPIILVCRNWTIRMAVEAVKNGAFDVIDTPAHSSEIVSRVRELLETKAQLRNGAGLLVSHRLRTANRLTARECEVLNDIVAGASSKETGCLLGISPRTVEIHREKLKAKLGARNSVDLIRIVLSEALH